MIRTRALRSLLLPLPLCLLAPPLSAQETGPALRTYELRIEARAADISPDERFVAAIVSRRVASDEPDEEKLVEAVQLWDFKSQKLIAEWTIHETTLHKYASAPSWPKLIAFSSDGQQLFISYGTRAVAVLQLPDLEETGRIALELPPRSTLGDFEFDAFACGLEPSPHGDLVAVRLCQPLAQSVLQTYDVNSGRMLWQWLTGETGWENHSFDNGLAWRPDGQRLALANGSRIAKVFVFDPQSGALLRVIHPGHSAGSVAFTPDNRLYTVDINAPGIVENKSPKIHIFDADSGKRLGTIAHVRSGVRYYVSASKDGRRLLGYTGFQTHRWDWGDMVFFPEHVDSKFTVWDLQTRQEIVTFRDMGWPAPSFRLSASGRLVLMLPFSGHVSILELPN